MKNPVNTIANKSIITLDIATWIPSESEIYELDLKPFLFKELILKEEEFKQQIEQYNWDLVKNKSIWIFCSNNAIIPTWAYMLLCKHLADFGIFYAYANNKETFVNLCLLDKINKMDLSLFENQRIVIKGCADKSIQENIYVALTAKLIPIARAISYGEPCSMVPIYRKKID